MHPERMIRIHPIKRFRRGGLLNLKKRMTVLSLCYLVFTGCLFCIRGGGEWYRSDHPFIQYTGRIDFSRPRAPRIFWPGTTVRVRFEGASIKAILKDEKGKNFFHVVVDGKTDSAVVIDCETARYVYPIASGLKDTVHTLEMMKRTESVHGATVFRGWLLESGRELRRLPPLSTRRIEFYGNSITCGMGNECPDEEGDSDISKENHYMAYGAITARTLDAQYVCIARSGIGLLVSWFDLIMPEYFYRLDPCDPESRWDFTSWIPDVVVINLFQNDSWLIDRLEPVPTGERIVEAYMDFILQIRSRYPEAAIFCTLGSMDAVREGSSWPGYIREAVGRVRTEQKDKSVFCHIFSDQGWQKHPRVRHHRVMAAELTGMIQAELDW